MFNLHHSHHFQLNSQYYTGNQIIQTNRPNIYLGGTKQYHREKSSQRKGISLTKSFFSQKKLSNQSYFRQNKTLLYQNSKFPSDRPILSLKPNFCLNSQKSIQANVSYSNRSLSSPLFIGNNKKYSQTFIGQISKNKSNNKKYTFPLKNNQSLKISQRIIVNPLINYSEKNLFKSKFSENIYKIPNINNVRVIPHSKQKINLVSPNSKLIMKSKLLIPSNRIPQSRILSPSYSKNINGQNDNIYLASNFQQKNNKFERQNIKFKTINVSRPKSPLYFRRQSIELKCQQNTNNLRTNEYESFPSLKYSKSTAEEQQTPFTSNQISQEDQKSRSRQNDKISNKSITKKYSVKSLWDSIEKSTVSVICQNGQIPLNDNDQRGFDKNCQKGYNELSGGNNFSSWMIQKFPADQSQ